MAFCPHNPSGPVANAATLATRRLHADFLYLETMATDVPWRKDVASGALPLLRRGNDGLLRARTRRGINEEAIARHPYQVHDLRHYTGHLTDIRPEAATATFGAAS